MAARAGRRARDSRPTHSTGRRADPRPSRARRHRAHAPTGRRHAVRARGEAPLGVPRRPEHAAATLTRCLGQPGFADHLALHRLACLASHHKLDKYEFAKEKLAELGREGIDPPPLLRGRDLLAMGFQEGPKIGKALHLVREAQLEGTIQSSEEARE